MVISCFYMLNYCVCVCFYKLYVYKLYVLQKDAYPKHITSTRMLSAVCLINEYNKMHLQSVCMYYHYILPLSPICRLTVNALWWAH